MRNLDDLHESFGLGRLFIRVDFLIFYFFDGGVDEAIIVCELGATQGTFMLDFDGALDTFLAKSVFASCDDRVVELLKTDGTFFLIVDAELKKHLQSKTILGVEDNHIVFFNSFHEAGNSVLAKFPMVTNLAHPKKDLENVSVFDFVLLARFRFLLKLLGHAFSLFTIYLSVTLIEELNTSTYTKAS